ncbi:hypothetical protein I4U23_001788 [Adineta vaga]|nr:hypothetical protein I4U23_001788 [Adineta vaga]
MSENDHLASEVDDEESMIKYLREKIIGHPAVFSRAGDLPIEDIPPIKRTNSQSSLNDLISTSTVSNGTTSQVEKLLAAAGGIHGGGGGGRRPASSSSPIIIPRKPPRSNASSHSSSSYTSVADQLSFFGDSSVPTDDVSMPALPSACQQLEHSAARDRISVKNKRRQPLKQKLSTLREADDNDGDLFASKFDALSSTPDEERSMFMTSHVESKILQPLVDLSDLDSARARLRMSARSRDRSADNILLATNSNITNEISSRQPALMSVASSPIQRSVSFKRPQEMNDMKLRTPPILKIKKAETYENDSSLMKPFENESTPIDPPLRHRDHDDETASLTRSRSSSHEHIYDNLDVFKRPKPTKNPSSHEDELSSSSTSSPITNVKTREHPVAPARLRPVTMLVSSNTEKQSANEFENVFNQFKKRGSIRRVQPNEEIMSVPIYAEEPPLPSPPPFVPIEPTNEPIISTAKTVETTPAVPQTPNRRKTLGGVYLPANNKVATNESKPAPSWIDIAKQKHNKFQSVSNEKSNENESEQQILHEQVPTIRKPTPSGDVRSNRKSMFEQSTNQSSSHILERDSIRALKAGNPNRINNLIQFFDK